MRRQRLLIGLVAAGFAWGQGGEEQIWKEYVAWYRKQPDAVSDPRRAYLDLLRRSGVGEVEIQERSKVIERLSGQRRANQSPVTPALPLPPK